MLLAVDVGNTNTVFALYEDRSALGQWRIATNRDRTGDEYAAVLIQLMALSGIRPTDVDACAIASVVPQAVHPLRRMARAYFRCEALVVGEDLSVDIPIHILNPREVGADRLVNAVAAHGRYPGALIVLDFGTATTFDVVDPDGGYHGGVIAPGINLSLEALHRAAAKLPRIAVERPPRVIGNGTVAAMQSGVYFGYVALIEGLVHRIRAEYGAPMTTIATGGLAPLFAGATDCIEHVDPDLTMAGLVELHHRHSAQKAPNLEH
jgi:type III pantothenate kinase